MRTFIPVFKMLKRADRRAEGIKAPAQNPKAQVQIPGRTWWKENTDSFKLFSDLRLPPCALTINIILEKKTKKKEVRETFATFWKTSR